MNRPVLLCHGGAGSKKPRKAALSGLEKILARSYTLLDEGGSALDAVTSAIVHMENSALYNAGKGANLQLDGIRRLDASIMEGNSLLAGAVIGLEGFGQPDIAQPSRDGHGPQGLHKPRRGKNCGSRRLGAARPD